MIELIKASASTQEAREKLVSQPWQSDIILQMLERAGPDAVKPEELGDEYGLKDDGSYYLSDDQAQAILEMRLNRLTNMEQTRLHEEYQELIDTIGELMNILAEPDVLMQLIRDELTAIRDDYGDERLTRIVESQEDLTMEDLIQEEDMVVTLSNSGYAKTQPLDTYRAQGRGGRGKMASTVKDEDFIERLMVAHTHDTILCFTNRGKVYWLRVFQIPPAGRASRGRPVINILPLEEDERVTAMLPVHEYREDQFIFMATSNGTVKKTPLMHFSRQRSSGLIAIALKEDNTLIGAAITNGTRDVMLFSSGGKGIRFKESDVRATARTAQGVRGIRLKTNEQVIALMIPEENGEILVASQNGYGKRSSFADFSVIGRGGQGVIGMKLSERNGNMAGAVQVSSGDEVILISDQGTLVRIRIDDVSQQGRNTQGVKLINLANDEQLVGLAQIQEPSVDDEESEEQE